MHQSPPLSRPYNTNGQGPGQRHQQQSYQNQQQNSQQHQLQQQNRPDRTQQYESIQLEEVGKRPSNRETISATAVSSFNGGRSEAASETLRKIHAQSSAETSGLGDSLQRMHALSSTETSGYGDTGGPSPTNQVSPYASAEAVQSFNKHRDLASWKEESRGETSSSGKNPKGLLVKNNSLDSDYYHDCDSPGFRQGTGGPGASWMDMQSDWMKEKGQRSGKHFESQEIIGHAQRPSVSRSPPYLGENSKKHSPTLRRSNTDSEARFLGKNTQSAWLKWSHDRRASFKRKVESIEKRQSELERERMSSPVRKARKESVRFVSPHLETQHLAEVVDEAIFGHPAFPFDIPISTIRSAALQPVREETKLTLGQWNALVAFWEHDLFVRLRYFGLLFGIVAIVAGVTSMATNHWSTLEDHVEYGSVYSGLWLICTATLNNCTLVEFHSWHVSVIGLLMFSIVFDLMAMGLSVGGVCTSSLPKKIYYYHSAGESHLLCAIGCAVALIIYPLTSVNLDLQHLSIESFGYSYFLCIVTCASQCTAAFCMCLDDLIHSIAKTFLCRSKKPCSLNNSTNKHI